VFYTRKLAILYPPALKSDRRRDENDEETTEERDMNRATQAQQLSAAYNNSSLLRQQLVREITCLERQLERLRLRDELLDMSTLQTYEEMISSRKVMLENLPWED